MLFKKPLTTCPFCYWPVNLNRVAFRCTGHAKAGRPRCTPKPDPKNIEQFNDSTPVMPAIAEMDKDGQIAKDRDGQPRYILDKESAECRSCGALSRWRLCPTCHQPLPRGLDVNSSLIGLAGTRNSGKTVLLSVLHMEMERRLPRQFNASIQALSAGKGLAKQLEQNLGRMNAENGSVPRQTARASSTANKTLPAVYEWRHEVRGKTRTTIFSFLDAAGEDLQTEERIMDRRYFGAVDGVMFLLDPFSFPANRTKANSKGIEGVTAAPQEALQSLITMLQTVHNIKVNRKIKTPLAVVVPKIDAFYTDLPANSPIRRDSPNVNYYDDTDGEEAHQEMAGLLNDWDDSGLVNVIQQYFDAFRLFGVSALGAEPDYSTGAMNRGTPIRPHRVTDPLLWLLAQRGFIERKEF